jgi:hypothetical protein
MGIACSSSSYEFVWGDQKREIANDRCLGRSQPGSEIMVGRPRRSPAMSTVLPTLELAPLITVERPKEH